MPPKRTTDTEEKTLIEPEQLDVIEQAASGAPVPFEVNGRKFTIEQPTPLGYERMRMMEAAAYRRALADPDIADLKEQPETMDARLKRAMRIGYLTCQAEYEHGDKRKDIDKELARLQVEAATSGSAAEEIAEQMASRGRDWWLLRTYLRDGDGLPLPEQELERLLSYAAFFEAARPAIWRVIQLMSDLPKFG